MAVDTEPKRWGMLRLSSGPGIVFNPTGSDADTGIERATVLGLYGGIAFQGVAAPVFAGTIPNITGNAGDSNIITDLSGYFTGATSYSIAPAVEAGWNFDTITGILTVDTDEANTFGTYVVTGTNSGGSDASNAFSVIISESSATGGWLLDYDAGLKYELKRRERARKKAKKARKKAEGIQSDLDKALAIAEREIEEEQGRREELTRLAKLADYHKATLAAANSRIEFAVKEVSRRPTFSKMERLERELLRLKEEEEFMKLAIEIILNE